MKNKRKPIPKEIPDTMGIAGEMESLEDQQSENRAMELKGAPMHATGSRLYSSTPDEARISLLALA